MRSSRARAGRLFALLLAAMPLAGTTAHDAAAADMSDPNWVGTWSAAAQPYMPGQLAAWRNQSLRLIVHTSVAGNKVRVLVSNRYGERPLNIGAAHVARRTHDAEIDPASDRTLHFDGQAATTIPAHAEALSDVVDLDVPALSDLAISLFLPDATEATTSHLLAQQTSYVSTAGDATTTAKFPVAATIDSWPFLTRIDVAATARAASVVAFGDSIVDGDGSSEDANQRWPDLLAARLHRAGRDIGVLNQGIIGNRLLRDSPGDARFGAALGEAGLVRFARDALDAPGAAWVIVRNGGNDLRFPGALTPASETATAQDLIKGYRTLIAQAKRKGIRIIGTTTTPAENATLFPGASTPQKEAARQAVNAWMRSSGEFDAVVDFDAVVRDPQRPARLLARYDSGDHLHPNDSGYAALAEAIPLSLFDTASGAK